VDLRLLEKELRDIYSLEEMAVLSQVMAVAAAVARAARATVAKTVVRPHSEAAAAEVVAVAPVRPMVIMQPLIAEFKAEWVPKEL
jgi:hypothetical protein